MKRESRIFAFTVTQRLLQTLIIGVLIRWLLIEDVVFVSSSSKQLGLTIAELVSSSRHKPQLRAILLDSDHFSEEDKELIERSTGVTTYLCCVEDSPATFKYAMEVARIVAAATISF